MFSKIVLATQTVGVVLAGSETSLLQGYNGSVQKDNHFLNVTETTLSASGIIMKVTCPTSGGDDTATYTLTFVASGAKLNLTQTDSNSKCPGMMNLMKCFICYGISDCKFDSFDSTQWGAEYQIGTYKTKAGEPICANDEVAFANVGSNLRLYQVVITDTKFNFLTSAMNGFILPNVFLTAKGVGTAWDGNKTLDDDSLKKGMTNFFAENKFKHLQATHPSKPFIVHTVFTPSSIVETYFIGFAKGASTHHCKTEVTLTYKLAGDALTVDVHTSDELKWTTTDAIPCLPMLLKVTENAVSNALSVVNQGAESIDKQQITTMASTELKVTVKIEGIKYEANNNLAKNVVWSNQVADHQTNNSTKTISWLKSMFEPETQGVCTCTPAEDKITISCGKKDLSSLQDNLEALGLFKAVSGINIEAEGDISDIFVMS